MNKDVIYIDVDDDITAIIGKMKASSEKIVALVPPKRVGVLQSAVNLRLLDRMAKTDKKHLVIITNNQALIALTASANIPVAKNLQSKPEIAEIPALSVDDGDDIIDGSELPVGDHAQSVSDESIDDATPVEKKRTSKADTSSSQSPLQRKPSRTDTLETLEIDGEAEDLTEETSVSKPSKSAKSKIAIPDFNRFRKRLFLAILAAVILIAILIWAFVIAPAATITITASTTPSPVSATVKLGGTAATDPKTGVISSETQQLKKNATVQFTPTGQKDEGQTATGTVTFSTNAISVIDANDGTGTTIPAGTQLTSSGGLVFTTDTAVTINSSNYNGAPVAITASASGTQYNDVTGAMSGAPSDISARVTNSGATTGGTSNVVTVVSDSDIQQALGQLVGQSTTSIEKQLATQFTNGEIVIASSFTSSQGTPVSSPASGQEVDNGAKATLTVPMTYTLYAFPKAAVETYLNANLTTQLTTPNGQQIYDNGLSNVGFSNFQKADDGTMTVNLTATGQIGPKIDASAIKSEVKGKITGDVQGIVGAINGVQSVDVNYSYFWVTKVPSNPNKVDIEFKLVHD